MFFQFFSYKRTGWQFPFIWVASLGMIFTVLAAVFILLRIVFASGLFFGLLFLFFILPVLARMFLSFFLKFLAAFLMKKAGHESKVNKNDAAGDVIDVAYKVVK